MAAAATQFRQQAHDVDGGLTSMPAADPKGRRHHPSRSAPVSCATPTTHRPPQRPDDDLTPRPSPRSAGVRADVRRSWAGAWQSIPNAWHATTALTPRRTSSNAAITSTRNSPARIAASPAPGRRRGSAGGTRSFAAIRGRLHDAARAADVSNANASSPQVAPRSRANDAARRARSRQTAGRQRRRQCARDGASACANDHRCRKVGLPVSRRRSAGDPPRREAIAKGRDRSERRACADLPPTKLCRSV